MAPLGLRVPWPQSAGRVQWLAPSGGYWVSGPALSLTRLTPLAPAGSGLCHRVSLAVTVQGAGRSSQNALQETPRRALMGAGVRVFVFGVISRGEVPEAEPGSVACGEDGHLKGRAAVPESALSGLVCPRRAPGHPSLLMGCTPPFSCEQPHLPPARQTGSWGGCRWQMCPGRGRTCIHNRLARNHSKWKILGAGQGQIQVL